MTEREQVERDVPMPSISPAPLRVLVFFLLLVAIAGSVGLGLYALTPPAERPALLNRLSSWAPTLVMLWPVVQGLVTGQRAERAASVAAIRAEQLHAKVEEVAENVDAIQRTEDS